MASHASGCRIHEVAEVIGNAVRRIVAGSGKAGLHFLVAGHLPYNFRSAVVFPYFRKLQLVGERKMINEDGCLGFRFGVLAIL